MVLLVYDYNSLISRSTVSGQRALVSGRWAMVSGQYTVVSGNCQWSVAKLEFISHSIYILNS